MKRVVSVSIEDAPGTYRERVQYRKLVWAEWRHRKIEEYKPLPRPAGGWEYRLLRNGRLEGWADIARSVQLSVVNLRKAYAREPSVRGLVQKKGGRYFISAKPWIKLIFAVLERGKGSQKKSAFANSRKRQGRGRFA